MNALEQLVSEILWMRGYWVQTSVKVKLTDTERQRINRPTSPRWEIDVVGYKAATNSLVVVECKSRLDSGGIREYALTNSESRYAKRYKLFHDPLLRSTILRRLKRQFVKNGLCSRGVRIQLCLTCDHIASDLDREAIKKHFKRKGWELWDEQWLKDGLQELSSQGYDNKVSSIITKILLR